MAQYADIGRHHTERRATACSQSYVLLKQVRDYCGGTPATWKWTLSSDNISLVNKINGVTDAEDNDNDREQQQWRPPPNDWAMWQATNEHDIEDPTNNWTANEHTPTNQSLEPDWDVINEIRWTLENDGIEGGNIFHLLGHQDRKKPYAELSLNAQLNVDADGLATKYQQLYGEERSQAFLFPHTSAHLHVEGFGTCTYRIPQTLRRAETAIPLYDYVVTRNGWTTHQANSVDWDAHGRAIKKQNKRRIHVTKLVHDILPTYSNLHRRNPRMEKCPNCEDGCPRIATIS
jgi:hypothetical protein